MEKKSDSLVVTANSWPSEKTRTWWNKNRSRGSIDMLHIPRYPFLVESLWSSMLANGLTKLCLGIDASPTLYMFFFVAAHRLAIRISKYSSSETQT